MDSPLDVAMYVLGDIFRTWAFVADVRVPLFPRTLLRIAGKYRIIYSTNRLICKRIHFMVSFSHFGFVMTIYHKFKIYFKTAHPQLFFSYFCHENS